MKLQKYFGYTIVNNILKSQKLSIILLGFIGLAPNDHHLNPYIFSRAPTFRLQAVRLLTTRLQQFVSTTIRLHYYSSPLLFVSTIIRLHYYSSPLLFVSRQFVSLRFFSNNSSPLLFVSITIRLHYYSSQLLFVSITIRLHYFSSPQNSSQLPFVSTTIRINYNSIIYSFVDAINNAGKNSYGGSFVIK